MDDAVNRRAIVDFSAANALKRANVLLFAYRGFAYDRIGDPASAVMDYRRSLVITPENAFEMRAQDFARKRLAALSQTQPSPYQLPTETITTTPATTTVPLRNEAGGLIEA